MQLATCEDNAPWLCTVHFYMDNDFNFYWVSQAGRRHSAQIAENANAAVTVVIHENTPEEKYVISVTATGLVEMLSDVEPEIRRAYIEKLDKPPHMLPDPGDPENTNEFYRLQPHRITIFDTKNFPNAPKQEFEV